MRPIVGEYVASVLGWYFNQIPFPYSYILLMTMVLFAVNLPRISATLHHQANVLLEKEAALAIEARNDLLRRTGQRVQPGGEAQVAVRHRQRGVRS